MSGAVCEPIATAIASATRLLWLTVRTIAPVTARTHRVRLRDAAYTGSLRNLALGALCTFGNDQLAEGQRRGCPRPLAAYAARNENFVLVSSTRRITGEARHGRARRSGAGQRGPASGGVGGPRGRSPPDLVTCGVPNLHSGLSGVGVPSHQAGDYSG